MIRRSAASAAILARHAHPDDAPAILSTGVRPEHASQGRIANAHGGDFERWLEAQHQRALKKGLLVRMAHVGAPTEPHIEAGRVVRDRRGRLLVAVVGVGPADYQGQLAAHLGGRPIALEAKSYERRLPREDIAPHQQKDLEACAAGNGIAVLVARLGGVIHAIPWREVPWCSPRGGKPSIGAADVASWRVDPRCELHPLDAQWVFYLSRLIAGCA